MVIFLISTLIITCICYLLLLENLCFCLAVGLFFGIFVTEIILEAKNCNTPQGKAQSKKRIKRINDYTNQYGIIEILDFDKEDKK